MPTSKKTMKVRDQKPRQDPKGGMGHRHVVNSGGGGGTGKNANRRHHGFAPN